MIAAGHLTLKALARFALARFEKACRRAGEARPNSTDESMYRNNADYWSFVEQVVKAAAELKG